MSRATGASARPTADELLGPAGTPRVVVIGAGFGGIAVGVNLKRAGIGTFTIYESSDGVGGTWWDNTYPGVEVDVDSNLYRYSFKPQDWSRTHAGHAELQAYLAETVAEFGLAPHLQLGRTVRSARWNHDQDLTDKVVAVAGTGSTAAQVVPAIQPVAGRVIVFQREPGWVLPKGERDLTAEERASLARPGRRRADRIGKRWSMERNLWGGAMFRPGSALNQKRERTCREYIDREFADRPDLREAVTPAYPFPGKRPVLATTYYPALREPNVELVPRAVERVTPTGIVDSARVERPVDVIVLATGFRAADYLARVEIVGRGGDAHSTSSGTANRRRSSASPSPASRTSSWSTGPAPTAANSCRCWSHRPSTRSGRCDACAASG